MSTVDLTASDPFSRYEIIDPEGAETPSPNMAVMRFEAPVKATQTDGIETGNNGIRVVGEAKKKKSLPPPPRRLLKHQSWSSESCREEAWIRKKDQQSKLRKSKSLTDDDVDELRGCIDLGFGFGFDSEDEGDHKLCDTLPALYFYYAVNKHYNGSKLKSSPLASLPSSSSSCDENSPEGHDLDTWIISSPGRWKRPKEVWEERVCIFYSSGKVETGKHFILECEAFKDNRESYADTLAASSWDNLFNEGHLL